MKKANKLIKEKSPYLLQHAYNPVDWFPWTEEAFEKARSEDKPIFLSIGYSTCHWCHVMEKESFEDEEVAALMNDAFVNIKVDREERPDIDAVYMSVCQMMTGGGGWPMTMIMTPEKKPFFAGTYFPKGSKYGRIGMLELVPRIKDVWQNKRSEINRSAQEITHALKQSSGSVNGGGLSSDVLFKAYADFERRFDTIYGGFGSAPKFPSPHNLCFLLRYYKRSGSRNALQMVEKTLTEMRKGGIYDHIGFGFARYSTDREWLVPHFEKMLYDQALLAIAYTELYLLTKNDFYKKTVEEILEYVSRDMTSPEGGFYSALDADSEGEEGKFYLWTADELNEILEKDEADLVISLFNVKKEGNWVDPMHGDINGTNILHMKKTPEEFSKENSVQTNVLEDSLELIRKKLFNHRKKRIHPHKDDKILTDWNGLMISAFARAASAFHNAEYTSSAARALKFIQNSLSQKSGSLFHRYRDGEAGLPAHIDDYAFIVRAALDLYEASFDVQYLQYALKLNDLQIDLFWDDEEGGFFFTSKDGEELIVRQKEIYDGAIPSGNSVSVLNLVQLARITGRTDLQNKADELVKNFSGAISQTPFIFSQFLSGFDFLLGPSYEFVIAGNAGDVPSLRMTDLVKKKFIPNKIILLKDESNAELDSIAPFTKDLKMIDGKTTLYICRDYSCEMPVNDLTKAAELINQI